MSIRTLAIFLQRLLAERIEPDGPIGAAEALDRMLAQPPPALQPLLTSHIDALLAGWPGAATLRPVTAPAAALWAGVALNNLAWSVTRPDSRLLEITLRLARALPPADDLPAQLAYHSLLRHLERLTPAPDWHPVVRELLARCPLTSVWLPRVDPSHGYERLLPLLAHAPLRVALRDRWLSLAPSADEVRRGLSADRAAVSAAVGGLVGQVLAAGPQWRAFVLGFYEAECVLLRCGDPGRPHWPLLEQLRAAQISADPRQRRHAERALVRYRPLSQLLIDESALRPYLYLDARFLELIAHA
ncbi:MAG: hypothetical protein HGA65_14140 [Oscillochloris sp.]|nr:hypothetical protein [Oscillochloris sp.]